MSAGSRLDVAVPIGIGRARGVAALGGNVADGGVAEEGVEGGDEFAPSAELAPGYRRLVERLKGDRHGHHHGGPAARHRLGSLLHTSPSDRYLRPRRPAPAFPYPPQSRLSRDRFWHCLSSSQTEVLDLLNVYMHSSHQFIVTANLFKLDSSGSQDIKW